MTASVLILEASNGRTWASFFRRMIASSAALRARALCSSVFVTLSWNVRVRVGVLEEPAEELHAEDARGGAVDGGHRDLPRLLLRGERREAPALAPRS
jgi:hypothetical protein